MRDVAHERLDHETHHRLAIRDAEYPNLLVERMRDARRELYEPVIGHAGKRADCVSFGHPSPYPVTAPRSTRALLPQQPGQARRRLLDQWTRRRRDLGHL